MEVKIHSSIREIEEEPWDELVGNHRLICTHRYLEAVERSHINDCRFFYPVVYEGGEIVAHTCVYFISTELDAFARGMAKRIFNGIRKFRPDFLILHSVECGTPVALGNTISFRGDKDRPERLRWLVRAVEQVACDMNVRILLFRDFFENERPFFDRLLAEGYRPLNNLPCARLDIRWSSFAEYLDSMRSPYRHKITDRQKKCEAAGIRFEVLTDFASLAPDLARLWRNAYDHAAEYKRELLLPAFFENVSDGLRGRASVILARRQGRPVGFALLLQDNASLEWLFCGLDYECNRRDFIYFNLLYHIINSAIERGCKQLNLGITTIIPKLDVGAVAVPLHMYMKHTNPVMNRIVPFAFRSMTPPHTAERRSVFKNRDNGTVPQ